MVASHCHVPYIGGIKNGWLIVNTLQGCPNKKTSTNSSNTPIEGLLFSMVIDH